MSKTLRKAIMKRSRLWNASNKKISVNWQNYKRQRNICSNILKSAKKTFFGNLNINQITDARKFWKTVKTFLIDKCKTSNNIILTEKNETINDNEKIPNTFNKHFTDINFENEESCKKIKENFGAKIFLLELFPRKMF